MTTRMNVNTPFCKLPLAAVFASVIPAQFCLAAEDGEVEPPPAIIRAVERDAAPAEETTGTVAAPAEDRGEYDFETDGDSHGDASADALARGERTSRLVYAVMPELHVSRGIFEAADSPRAWTNFLDSLDPQRFYFTAEDVASFEPIRFAYADRLRNGDVTPAREMFEVFRRRVREHHDFIASAVSNEFDFATPDEWRWRRKNAAWPSEGAEQNELWLRRVKNAILAARVSRVIRDERKKEKNAAGVAGETGETGATGATGATNETASAASSDDKAREDLLRASTAFLDVLHDADEQFWLEKWLDAMATSYDPHSNYMSPATSEDFGIDMQLSLQGIGAQLRTDDGAAKIVEIIPGSPAERDDSPEHLVPGDKIIGVAQEGDEEFTDIRHWPLYKSVRLIRGPKGSTVRLRVIPANDPDGIKIVTLVRDEIKFEDQAAFSRVETERDSTGVERTLGYLRLPSFYASSIGAGDGATPRRASLDMAEEIASLNAAGVEGLVLDLRSNGGGSLPEAVYVAGLFMRTGPVVIVRERRRPVVLPDNDPAVAFRKPVVVLTDRLSASASEIVAAALQDYGRAVVVGDERTHGKGTVQTLVPLENGALGSLKATTALFYRVSGSSTQRRGVESDIVLPSVFSTYPELGEDNLPGALPWTRIAPSFYRPVDDLSEAIPELRARSEARLSTNEAWQARSRLLERFAAANSNDVVSLQWDARLERAREDARLNREIERLNGGPVDDGDEFGGDDDYDDYGDSGDSDSGGDSGDDSGDSDAAEPGSGGENAAESGGDRGNAVKKSDADSGDAAAEAGVMGGNAAEESSAITDPDAPSRRRSRRDSKKRDPNDLVLTEALSILTDLIDVHGSPESLGGQMETFDFLRSFFR